MNNSDQLDTHGINENDDYILPKSISEVLHESKRSKISDDLLEVNQIDKQFTLGHRQIIDKLNKIERKIERLETKNQKLSFSYFSQLAIWVYSKLLPPIKSLSRLYETKGPKTCLASPQKIKFQVILFLGLSTLAAIICYRSISNIGQPKKTTLENNSFKTDLIDEGNNQNLSDRPKVIQKAQTNKDMELLVSIDQVRLRKGPGTSFEVLTQIYPNQYFEVIEKRNSWVKIEFFDFTKNKYFKGWSSLEYFKKANP